MEEIREDNERGIWLNFFYIEVLRMYNEVLEK